MTFDVDAQGLGSVLAAVPQYIIVVDRDGIIRYVNRVQEGFDIRAIIGTHSTAVIAPESVASREAALRLVFANGTVEEYEVDVSTCGSSFPSVRGATGSGPARTRGRRSRPTWRRRRGPG